MNTEMFNDVNVNTVAETPVVEDATMDTVTTTVSSASSEFMEGAKSVLKPKGLGGAVVTAGIAAAIVGAGWMSVKVGKKCASFFTKTIDSATKIIVKKSDENKNEKEKNLDNSNSNGNNSVENKGKTTETTTEINTEDTIETTASEVKEGK